MSTPPVVTHSPRSSTACRATTKTQISSSEWRIAKPHPNLIIHRQIHELKTPVFLPGSSLSGRKDLNLRPLAPHASTLAGLRHAPISTRPVLYIPIIKSARQTYHKVVRGSAHGIQFMNRNNLSKITHYGKIWYKGCAISNTET